MKYALPKYIPHYGRHYEIIEKMTIENNELVEYTFHNSIGISHGKIGTKKGDPIFVNPNDCEWLGPTFFRNENTLYGFSLIEKSSSSHMFLTPIQRKIDFASFEIVGEYYAKDKNRYYYGPGGKVIDEQNLELYYDETYKEDWYIKNPERQKDKVILLWNSHIIISSDTIYWKGVKKKGVLTSLKRVTSQFFLDDESVYYFDLQNIKKMEDIDRASVIYTNITGDDQSLYSFISDAYKPLLCYFENPQDINWEYQYKSYKLLFERYSKDDYYDYWWYKYNSPIKK